MSQLEKGSFERFLQQSGGRQSSSLLFLAYQMNHKPELAGPFATYLANRDGKIAEFAKASNDQELLKLQASYEALFADQTKAVNAFVDWQRRYDNLRRVLIVRRELAGLALLGEMKDTQALTELKGLLACESASI